jgi:small subunit ribosomal protein S9
MLCFRKRQHDMFLVREQAEFELGKQHLANMMGMDPDNMTQGTLTH